MYILAIDTSNQVLGVAIMKDDEVVGEMVTNIAKNHSVRLMPAIDQLMKDVQITPEQLEKIVVAEGPGSYTGVRIGMTTAKTLAWALQIPITGASSLKVLAYQGIYFDGLICPFFDARRGRVYTGLYHPRDERLQLEKAERNTDMQGWLHELAVIGKPVLFLSPDMEKHRAAIASTPGLNAFIPQAKALQTSNPSHLVLASEENSADAVYHMTPNYLRLAEAEAKWLKAEGKKVDE
ncbi:tRNA (adenosine(37)-N6)-threonylcarbamoyltransferase complex dimerization subunit type 1 TsaB [Virgibacillus halophilus]|uniref:tRNA (Adenosine(37)-N6)-threonylcarbamoyltransferase complex dimerization subunit type 1 TsaB n=1 Tax=Tigheibacillus halophilus TaxID=361280 RepID=A0ABU5C814_9BACI|nr:tRNA (adenosine(37)-N6)-threonylcarbamoyltransferase complex dimerization subunit type 1 TsaB [Virgibacillus halophilus]